MTALEQEATRRGIRPPGVATLRRYGLTAIEWLELMAAQGWKCPICHKRSGVRWVTDHEHVPRWKHRPPEERKQYVRGVLCDYDNRWNVPSRMSSVQSQRITDYLAAYEERRDA